MTDLYFFILTIINLFVVGFMCILVSYSETLYPKQKKTYQATFFLIGLISALELVTVLVDDTAVKFRLVNLLANYLGFGLTPAVPVLIVCSMNRSEEMPADLKAAAAIELLYLLVLTGSMFTGGLVFSVDEMNHYSRQWGFPVYMTMYYGGTLYLVYHTLKMARTFQNRGRIMILCLAGFLVAGTMVQIMLPAIHITWLCVTVISVLYYLYCNEMWSQLDGLTGLLSQKSYLNRTLNLKPDDRMLVVLDLDDFKYVNDTYGHQAGDQCLQVIAECLKKAYARYGNCYRIGGDEFCVLLKDLEKEKYCREKFFWAVEKRKKSLRMLPGASYGSAMILEQESISDTKARADQNMYENKRERKKRQKGATASQKNDLR